MKKFLLIVAGAMILVPLLGFGAIYAAHEAYERGYYKYSLLVFKPLAASGVDIYQTYLGIMYSSGEGVPRDYVKAVKWLNKPGENGYPNAQYLLGLIYYIDQGGMRDPAKAFGWVFRSAQQNFRPAQALVSNTYPKGDHAAGVTQDKIQGYKWFLIAAGGQIPDSHRDMIPNNVTEDMSPAEIFEAQQLANEWIAEHGKKR